MTPQISQTPKNNLQAEIDWLTHSAYLLTLDLGKAFSAVERAINRSPAETTVQSDLLERTVEAALEGVLCEAGTSWDGEASALMWRSTDVQWRSIQRRSKRCRI